MLVGVIWCVIMGDVEYVEVFLKILEWMFGLSVAIWLLHFAGPNFLLKL